MKIEHIENLSEECKTLYLYILKAGGASIDEIAVDCRIPLVQAKEITEVLCAKHLIEMDRNRQDHFFKITAARRAILDHWQKLSAAPITPLQHQFAMLCDDNRLRGFRDAIAKTVLAEDVVADLGAGTGIMSLLAAEMCKRVYAVEFDKEVERFGRAITSRYSDRINYILADARTIMLPEKVDVIICEMIDTALVAELQVSVVNYAIEHLLKPGGRIIPAQATTKVQLVEFDYDVSGYEFKIPLFVGHGARKPRKTLSDEVTFHEVDFHKVNATSVKRKIQISVRNPGIVNGLQILTYTYAADEILMKPSPEPNTWFNPPFIIPVEETMLSEEDLVTLELSYEMGGGWGSCTINMEVNSKHHR